MGVQSYTFFGNIPQNGLTKQEKPEKKLKRECSGLHERLWEIIEPT
jgi:hypothetical protein